MLDFLYYFIYFVLWSYQKIQNNTKLLTLFFSPSFLPWLILFSFIFLLIFSFLIALIWTKATLKIFSNWFSFLFTFFFLIKKKLLLFFCSFSGELKEKKPRIQRNKKKKKEGFLGQKPVGTWKVHTAPLNPKP